MKIITIFISALLYCCLLGAQKGQSLFKDITPSPNSCALAQYVDYPVSLYTGTPSINITTLRVSGLHKKLLGWDWAGA